MLIYEFMKLSDEDNNNLNNDLDKGVLLEAKPKVKKPSMYNVLLLNDDYTPMEFVVFLLKVYFRKNHNEASKIMLEVHNKGSSICGVYTYEIAETKILKVVNSARNNDYPLLCILEKI